MLSFKGEIRAFGPRITRILRIKSKEQLQISRDSEAHLKAKAITVTGWIKILDLVQIVLK